MRDGSTAWDVWAIAVIILESDMRPGEYLGVNSEHGAHTKAIEHSKDKETCGTLRYLLQKTMLKSELSSMEGLLYVRKQLQSISFRKYGGFRVVEEEGELVAKKW